MLQILLPVASPFCHVCYSTSSWLYCRKQDIDDYEVAACAGWRFPVGKGKQLRTVCHVICMCLFGIDL